MSANPHFARVASWADARAWLTFEPLVPRETLGHATRSLDVFVRDHRDREVAPAERTLEAHFGAFSLSQSAPGEAAARRLALETPYGRGARAIRVAGHEGRAYDRGPEREPGDVDPRMPAVVTWCDGARFFMLASADLAVEALARIGASLSPGEGAGASTVAAPGAP